MNTYRIFLSSPGDVGRERETAIHVVERLKSRWSGKLEVDLYVWEHEPMLASRGDFQDNIPEPREFDLVICVLWSRLGTRLHPVRHQRLDGSAYSSGTEYEFETALEGFRTKQSPDLLFYRRKEIPLFPATPKERRMELEYQWEALETFCRKWFIDEQYGSLKLAYNSYENLAQFEESLEQHLQQLILARQICDKEGPLSHAPQVQWTGQSPYRGLQVFEAEHEPIFFGRTKQRDEILGTLQSRWIEEKKPFVLIFGASGSGKSSLLRAGVMPWLCRPGVIDGVAVWRSLLYRPSDCSGDLIEGLAAALIAPGALPEIGADGTDRARLAELLRQDPPGVALLAKEALSRAAGDEQRKRDLVKQPVARLALGLDQLEEIVTLSERFTQESRTVFFQAIRALVSSGYGWVVVTLRSDFFKCCDEIPELGELAQGKGQYRLTLPSVAQLSQVIRYPAEAAGVVFEEHPDKGRLDERIRDDALKEPGGLPLLEYALDELFRTGSEGGVLTHAGYEALGGVEGALRKRADETLQHLKPSEQVALGTVLRHLIRLGSGDDETLTRRVASYEAATASPGAKGLVDAFVAARLLTADCDSSGARTVMVAHEALFRVWPEICRWEKENRDFLRVRARLGEAIGRWIECGRPNDYLLGEGRPLAEAEELLKKYKDSLDPEEREYIVASRARISGVGRRRRRAVLGVIAILTIVAAVAVWQWREAVSQKGLTESARKNAEGILQYLLYGLRDKLATSGDLALLEDVQQRVEAYCEKMGWDQQDPNLFYIKATLLQEEGDLLLARGNPGDAKEKYEKSFEISRQLASQAPNDRGRQRNLAVIYEKLGELLLRTQGHLSEAGTQITNSLQIYQRLVAQDQNDNDGRFGLSICYQRLGDILIQQGQLPQAKTQQINSLHILESLYAAEPDKWARFLAIAYERLGDLLSEENDVAGAKAQYVTALGIAQHMADVEPGNNLWQLRLSSTYERLGDILAPDDITGARTQYLNALNIREELVKRDPTNGEWRRALATSHEKLGDLLLKQNNLGEAKDRYNSALSIREEFVKAHPDNCDWQLDLAVSHEKLGDLLAVEQQLGQATGSFKREIDIVKTLIKGDSSNEDWQSRLIQAHKKLGQVLQMRQDRSGAISEFKDSLMLLTKLIELHGETPDLKDDREWLEEQLGPAD